ncbi:unnamed protein product, partial [Ixodes persulcatus]
GHCLCGVGEDQLQPLMSAGVHFGVRSLVLQQERLQGPDHVHVHLAWLRPARTKDQLLNGRPFFRRACLRAAVARRARTGGRGEETVLVAVRGRLDSPIRMRSLAERHEPRPGAAAACRTRILVGVDESEEALEHALQVPPQDPAVPPLRWLDDTKHVSVPRRPAYLAATPVVCPGAIVVLVVRRRGRRDQRPAGQLRPETTAQPQSLVAHQTEAQRSPHLLRQLGVQAAELRWSLRLFQLVELLENLKTTYLVCQLAAQISFRAGPLVMGQGPIVEHPGQTLCRHRKVAVVCGLRPRLCIAICMASPCCNTRQACSELSFMTLSSRHFDQKKLTEWGVCLFVLVAGLGEARWAGMPGRLAW